MCYTVGMNGEPFAELESLGSRTTCPNCGAERTGRYCRDCGQRFPDDRLALRTLLRELPARYLNLEQGFLATLIGVLRHPGKVARRYVLGERRKVSNPLTLMLLGASLQLLVLALFQDVTQELLADGIADARARAPGPYENLDAILGEPAEVRMPIIYSSMIRGAYTYAALLFFCFPFAALLRLLRSDDPVPLRFAEHLIFSLYTVSCLLVLTAFTNLLTFAFAKSLQPYFAFGTYLIYGGYMAHTGFYPDGFASRLRTFAAFLLAVFTFFVSLAVILIVYVVLHLVMVGGGG